MLEDMQIFEIILEYIWVPIILPIIVFLLKSILYVKEIKNMTEPEVEEFKNLYNSKIKKELKICSEEILRFLEKREGESVEHHLYICKKFKKTIGFIKFMYSEQCECVFIAYVGIDKDDALARQYALKLMLKKIYNKYFKKKRAKIIITEVERSSNGKYKTGLVKSVSRYSKSFKKSCYILEFDYIQPIMPDEQFENTNEIVLSLVYIPAYSLSNKIISKDEILKIIEMIYFEIYYPSCNEVKLPNCNSYNIYLENIIETYKKTLPSYIKLLAV